MDPQPLWLPDDSRRRTTLLWDFMQRVGSTAGVPCSDYAALHRWSVDDRAAFWGLLWDHAGVIAENRGEAILVDPDAMPGARFFPDARLSFAANLLRNADERDAIVFRDEDGSTRRLTRSQLDDAVRRLATAMADRGVRPGDRVAGYLPNLPEAVVAMLAAATLGAAWSSCSPDFGVEGVLDRFGQIEPRLLVAADGYRYKGRSHDTLSRLRQLLPAMPSVRSTLVVGHLAERPDLSDLDGAERLADVVAASSPMPDPLPAFPFEQPLYVLFSSGTTGKPKCIVHGAGGTLLKHLAEHRLMCDVRPGDRVFYYTTLGWMMWNWLVSALASEATLLLYDGHPSFPAQDGLFEFFAAERGTLFGTSAKYIDAMSAAGSRPGEAHDLQALRTLTSTGSPLSPAGFDWVYESVKRDVCLSSISGGTDIVGCFVGGNPIGPVWRGEIQAPALGMAVEIFDDEGSPLATGKGELVCTRPFPSMPLGFWGDDDGSRYRAAYFERFPGVWHHGDYAEATVHGGYVIHGRSDATLNPGGVRIGTAEIYRQVEALPEVVEAIAVGQEWHGDVRVVLFVVLAGDLQLDDELRRRIRDAVRAGCSPRHVPAVIAQVAEIPRTKSGKIVELAVRDVIHGRQPRNLTALANPEALQQYRDRPELAAGRG